MANIGNIAARLTLDTKGWVKNLNVGRRTLTSFVRKSGRTLLNFAKRASFYLSIIGGVGLTGLITQFAKFEEAMRNVNTIARQNEKQFLRTSKTVVLLAREFGRLPIGLAQALYDINSASFTATKGLKVLKAATVAGRAGLSTTREAARAITGALNAYALSAEHARDISDTMFQTVKFGVLTFGELSQSLGIAVSTAAAAKVPFDQLAAAAATMTRGGISVREAFTALNRVMLRIIQNRGALGKVFATTAEGSGAAMLKVRGLAGTMAFLEKITQGEAQAMIALGFMVRDLKAALSLTRNEGRDYARDIARIADKNKRAGATMQAFKEQTKALSFQFALLRSVFASLLIVIGRLIAPLFRSFLKDITNQISKLDDWVKSIKFTEKQWRAVYKRMRTFVLSWATRIQFGLLMMWDVTKRVFSRITIHVLKFKLVLNDLFFWVKRFFDLMAGEVAGGRAKGIWGFSKALDKVFRQIQAEQRMAKEDPLSIFTVKGAGMHLYQQGKLYAKIIGLEKNRKDILGGISQLKEREIRQLQKIAAWTEKTRRAELGKRGIMEQARKKALSAEGPRRGLISRFGYIYPSLLKQKDVKIGAETVEKGTVEAFRAERGLKDPASKAAEETSANTRALLEVQKRALELAKQRKVVTFG